VAALVAAGIKVSLFIAADGPQVDRSRAIGAAQIELHTGEYAHGGAEGNRALGRIFAAASHANSLGLEVAAGHGLTQDNVPELVRIPYIVELNIGHALVSDAVFVGMRAAVAAYNVAIERGVAQRTGGR
jgi:pyridoxine 5-phosphate synthase